MELAPEGAEPAELAPGGVEWVELMRVGAERVELAPEGVEPEARAVCRLHQELRAIRSRQTPARQGRSAAGGSIRLARTTCPFGACPMEARQRVATVNPCRFPTG